MRKESLRQACADGSVRQPGLAQGHCQPVHLIRRVYVHPREAADREGRGDLKQPACRGIRSVGAAEFGVAGGQHRMEDGEPGFDWTASFA